MDITEPITGNSYDAASDRTSRQPACARKPGHIIEDQASRDRRNERLARKLRNAWFWAAVPALVATLLFFERRQGIAASHTLFWAILVQAVIAGAFIAAYRIKRKPPFRPEDLDLTDYR